MCGIAGKLSWSILPSFEVVKQMCDNLAHRGPDASGIVQLPNIVLGHRRLSIIDLSESANQPMYSLDKRYYIVYNGEIYNFKQIRGMLEDEGYSFRTRSDTEVVLYAYVLWKEECLNKFNGMFAFAIWDDQRKELFMARDRFGKKPLYYYIDEQKGIVFASEITALLLDESIPRQYSYEALNCYLALGYILSPMTMFKDIYKLESATYMHVADRGNSIKKVKYWDYLEKFSVKIVDKPEDICHKLVGLLQDSVKMRMVSDVPIGAFLSGGIDSSSIAYFMKKFHQDELHTFSIGFEEKNYDESLDAEKAARWIGTRHHTKICKFDNNLKMIDQAIDAFDELFSDNSLIPMVEVSRLASTYVKVVLSGDGADEIFAGYPTYQADKLYFYVKYLPLFFKKFLANIGTSTLPQQPVKVGFRYKRKKFFKGTQYSPEKAHYFWRNIFTPEERLEILGGKFKDLVYDTDPYLVFEKYYLRTKHLHWLDRYLYVDSMTWLSDDILMKVDRASMHSGVEVRNPYLDINLVSYVASIPASLKMKGLRTKYIFRRALNGVLPKFIIDKKKSGFNAPTGVCIGYDGIDEFKAFNKYVYFKKVKNGTA